MPLARAMSSMRTSARSARRAADALSLVARSTGTSRTGAPDERERLEAAQQESLDAPRVGRRLELDAGVDQGVDGQGGLGPGQRGPEAEVDAVAEREVVARAPPDVEAVGIVELPRVAVPAAEAGHDHRVGGDLDAGERERR